VVLRCLVPMEDLMGKGHGLKIPDGTRANGRPYSMMYQVVCPARVTE
jgi:hypothetical protein